MFLMAALDIWMTLQCSNLISMCGSQVMTLPFGVQFRISKQMISLNSGEKIYQHCCSSSARLDLALNDC